MSHRVRVVVLRLSVALLCVAASGPLTRAVVSKRVSGSLVFWDQSRGFEAIARNADVFSEVSPFWYRVESDGRVVPYTTASGVSYEDDTILSYLRAQGILILPTVANIVDGVWNGAAVSAILADPLSTSLNIANLTNLAVVRGYDGIDLDYENLAASDRTAYSAFVSQLAAALHARGKRLAVNVYAKTAEPGTWSGPQAQDWWAIGQAADQVRIMTYEYSWSTSAAGPIAPLNWVTDVIGFARSVVPAAKIMQGIPFYGYDWIGQRGTPLVWNDVVSLAAAHAATVNWDSPSASPWFEYISGSTRHTVWFENASSVTAKLSVATAYDVGGVTLWRLGGEDPGNWTALRQFGGAAPPPDTTPPTIAITSPADGAVLGKKQTIAARASDDVLVSRVEFYANGVMLATDTQAPYAVTWNTQRANRGANTITAIAYDPTGNSTSAQVTAYTRR